MNALRSYLIIIIFNLLAILVVGCSSTKLETPLTEGEALKVLYDNAMGLVKKRDYVDAAILFEDIERQYPYSKWSSQAQLMGAFCYYKSNMHDDSLNSIERFISLYPANEKIGYATYLTALNYYAQIQDVSRDQSMTEQALISFNEVINRYSDTDFAIDSKNKIDVINDRLAAKEIEVARFYQFDSQWIAAINRYNLILDKYKTSIYTEEALYRLVEIYLSIGLIVEAKKYAATLGYNYSEGKWYEKSYKLIERNSKI